MSQIFQGELPYPEHRRVVDVEVILGGGGSGSAVDPWIWWILCIDFTLLYAFYMSYMLHFCIFDEPMSWLGTCLLKVLGSDLTTEYVKINADYRSWWLTRVPQWWDLLSIAIYCYATSLYDVSHRFFNCDLTWFDNLMLWKKKSGKKPSPQCTVYSSKIVSYDLAGMPPLWGGAKIKRWPLLGGRFWKLGTEVHFLEGWSRVKHVEALTLEDSRLGIQLIWTSDVQQVGRGLLCGLIIFCLKTYDPARLAASHCLFLTSPVPGTVLSSKGEGARDVRWQKSHAFFRSCKQ